MIAKYSAEKYRHLPIQSCLQTIQTEFQCDIGETFYEKSQIDDNPDRDSPSKRASLIQESSNIFPQVDLKKIDSKKLFHDSVKQTPFHNFFSISEIYQQTMRQKLSTAKRSSMQNNFVIKLQKQNSRIRNWKLSLYKKTMDLKQSRRNICPLKNSQIKYPTFLSIGFQQIELHKCQCGKSSMAEYLFNRHLRRSGHQWLYRINTKKERVIQAKIYNQLRHQINFHNFNKNWLYKSFQIIFFEADLHHSQREQSYIQEMVQKFYELYQFNKDLVSLPIGFNEKQLDSFFLIKWIEIYRKLHEYHKGYERLYHKCMTMTEQKSIFSLGLIGYLEKNRQSIFKGSHQVKFQQLSNALKSYLAKLIDPNQKRSLEPTYPQARPFFFIIHKLLSKYLELFQYIDVSDLQFFEH